MGKTTKDTDFLRQGEENSLVCLDKEFNIQMSERIKREERKQRKGADTHGNLAGRGE